MKNLSYCAQEVYKHDRDRFWLSLFVPPREREGLLALYALNIELAQVHAMVSEEMIGHIRYAWWQESLDGLYAGAKRPGHPVLEALGDVIEAGHMPQNNLSSSGLTRGSIQENTTSSHGAAMDGQIKSDHDNRNILKNTLILLIEEYRNAYPQFPSDIDAVMEKISLNFIELACPQAEASWRKAFTIISNHRRKYGQRWSSWLNVKLLITGF